jgi:hypothetical protein
MKTLLDPNTVQINIFGFVETQSDFRGVFCATADMYNKVSSVSFIRSFKMIVFTRTGLGVASSANITHL